MSSCEHCTTGDHTLSLSTCMRYRFCSVCSFLEGKKNIVLASNFMEALWFDCTLAPFVMVLLLIDNVESSWLWLELKGRWETAVLKTKRHYGTCSGTRKFEFTDLKDGSCSSSSKLDLTDLTYDIMSFLHQPHVRFPYRFEVLCFMLPFFLSVPCITVFILF